MLKKILFLKRPIIGRELPLTQDQYFEKLDLEFYQYDDTKKEEPAELTKPDIEGPVRPNRRRGINTTD